MATKVQTKASEETKSVALVTVPSQVQTAISESASAETAKVIAVSTAEQSTVKLGKLVGTTMGKHPYETVRLSLKPLFEAAYKASNDKVPANKKKEDKAVSLYAGQQLSRIMGIAYPGGKEASPEQRKAIVEEVNKVLAKNPSLPTNTLYRVYGGKVKLDKKGELTEVKKSNRGGGNAKKPIDAFRDTLANAMSTAKSAKLTAEQMLTVFGDILVDLEMIEDASELRNMLE